MHSAARGAWVLNQWKVLERLKQSGCFKYKCITLNYNGILLYI
jgi:hypothetical protein